MAVKSRWQLDGEGKPTNYTREWARQFAYEGGAGILPADGRARFMDRDVNPSTYAPDFADASKNRWPLTRGGTAKRCPRAATALDTALSRATSRAPRVKGQYAGGWGYESPAGDGFAGAPGGLILAGVNPDLPPITLMHVGARWYDPSLGRFIQRDPLGLRGGLNVYAYCENVPLDRADPRGLKTKIDHNIVITQREVLIHFYEYPGFWRSLFGAESRYIGTRRIPLAGGPGGPGRTYPGSAFQDDLDKCIRAHGAANAGVIGQGVQSLDEAVRDAIQDAIEEVIKGGAGAIY